ncbi:MAG: TIGR03435 family protein [Bryobacteraceae bacterium]
MKSFPMCCAIFFSTAIAAFAQTPAPLAFEVASIKPAGALDPMAIAQGKVSVGMKVDGAICNIGSFSLRDLVRAACEVKDYQVSGLDSLGAAMSAQRFNIQATLPEGATEKQVPQMLQTLLAERFKLVIHRETRDQSVYALVVAKGGPKLKESEPDPPAPETPPDAPDASKKGETVIGQGSNQLHISGNMADGKGITMKGGPTGQLHMTMVDGKMHMEAAKMTMAGLADAASSFVGRPVVDMTELKGNYQVTLDLSMDDLKSVAKAAGLNMPGTPGGNAGNAPVDAADPSGSSIFASVQQLGLKLEARKAPLPFVVVDHFEKSPTEN